MSAAPWSEPAEAERPGPCKDCKRLRRARLAAAAKGDLEWTGQVMAEIVTHRVEDHGQQYDATAGIWL